MNRYQNASLLGVIARGSSGGQARADGSSLEAGVHLRWQIEPALGFPKGGFDIYRRRRTTGITGSVARFARSISSVSRGCRMTWIIPGLL